MLLACKPSSDTGHNTVKDTGQKANNTTTYPIKDKLSATVELYLEDNELTITLSNGCKQNVTFILESNADETLALAADLATIPDDYNFDGFKDFAISFHLGTAPTPQTHIFTCNPQAQTFSIWEVLSDVEVIPDQKILVNSFKNGPGWQEESYIIVDGNLTIRA